MIFISETGTIAVPILGNYQAETMPYTRARDFCQTDDINIVRYQPVVGVSDITPAAIWKALSH
ncbi:MAG: hypothetical protein ACU0CA_00060 [Paracoccaceae bacterium]